MTHGCLLKRVRAEYIEMPGLRVTLEQGQRLFGLEWTPCKAVFDALVDEQFLRVNTQGLYTRVSDGALPDSWSAEAHLGIDPRVVVST